MQNRNLSKYTSFYPKCIIFCPNCLETCPNSNIIFGNSETLSPLKIQSPAFESECARIFFVPLLYPELFQKNLIFIFKFGQKPVNLVRNPTLALMEHEKTLTQGIRRGGRVNGSCVQWITRSNQTSCNEVMTNFTKCNFLGTGDAISAINSIGPVWWESQRLRKMTPKRKSWDGSSGIASPIFAPNQPLMKISCFLYKNFFWSWGDFEVIFKVFPFAVLILWKPICFNERGESILIPILTNKRSSHYNLAAFISP